VNPKVKWKKKSAKGRGKDPKTPLNQRHETTKKREKIQANARADENNETSQGRVGTREPGVTVS